MTIYVDADACPVKDEVLRVAERHGINVFLVSNGGIRPPANPLARLIIVPPDQDAADNWIADHITVGDIAVTNDIPLAAQCIEKNANAIRPNGEPFTEAAIGLNLANRELMVGLRETGTISGGPLPFSKRDRSRFLSAFETMVQASKRK